MQIAPPGTGDILTKKVFAKATSGNRCVGRNFAVMAIALGLWGTLVLLFAAPLALTSSVSWRQTVRFGASFWALWLLLLPVVAWLSFRFPIERKKLFRNLGLHLFACLLVVAANRATFHAMEKFLPRAQRSPPVGPPAAFGVFLGLRAGLDVLVYWSLLGVCQAITNFRSAQERERRAVQLEARLTTAKLQALRMQINPHFLFNTLNSIAALIYVDPRAADEMLGDLSELLRRSLHSMEEQEVPLGQELEFIGAYLKIEQKRFGERLQLEQRVPDQLMKALVPALILQPLVENAIRHGIEPQRGVGLISIEARQKGKQLHLIVRDNGRGLQDVAPNSSVDCGIGLANTRARLQGLYNQDQSFSFGRAEPQGCRVDIHLPFHLEPAHIPSVPKGPAA